MVPFNGGDERAPNMSYAKTAFAVGKCHLYARVDFFYNDGHIWINEVNTLPGLTLTSHYPVLIAQNGYTMEQVVAILLDDALEQYRKSLEKTYIPPVSWVHPVHHSGCRQGGNPVGHRFQSPRR